MLVERRRKGHEREESMDEVEGSTVGLVAPGGIFLG